MNYIFLLHFQIVFWQLQDKTCIVPKLSKSRRQRLHTRLHIYMPIAGQLKDVLKREYKIVCLNQYFIYTMDNLRLTNRLMEAMEVY